jgi:hypothetical protein
MADLKQKPDFIQSLRKEGYNFNFFQALELLEEKFFKENGIKNPLETARSSFRRVILKKSKRLTAFLN